MRKDNDSFIPLYEKEYKHGAALTRNFHLSCTL